MNFNHISKKLTEDEVSALTNLYHTYHKKYWCFKKMFKKYQAFDLSLKLSSVILTTTGTIIGAITLNPIFLSVVTGSGVFLQTIGTQKNFSKKVEACRYAFQSYQKLLNKLKLCLRSGKIDEYLEKELATLDDQIAEMCPPISDSYQKSYCKVYSSK